MRQRYVRLRERTVGRCRTKQDFGQCETSANQFCSGHADGHAEMGLRDCSGQSSAREEEWERFCAALSRKVSAASPRTARDSTSTRHILRNASSYVPKIGDVKALAPFLLDRGESPLHIAHALFFRFKDYEAGKALLRDRHDVAASGQQSEIWRCFFTFVPQMTRRPSALLRKAIKEATPREAELMETLLGVTLVNGQERRPKQNGCCERELSGASPRLIVSLHDFTNACRVGKRTPSRRSGTPSRRGTITLL